MTTRSILYKKNKSSIKENKEKDSYSGFNGRQASFEISTAECSDIEENVKFCDDHDEHFGSEIGLFTKFTNYKPHKDLNSQENNNTLEGQKDDESKLTTKKVDYSLSQVFSKGTNDKMSFHDKGYIISILAVFFSIEFGKLI